MSLGAPEARLSNYRLERLLGSGGMGSVYLARDLALDRDVAIKFIAPDKAADASARHRLIREARAAAALDHPNICGVHEVIVEPDGRAAIVMQYVEGETLADTLRRGPLDVRFAMSIATDVANALLAAHRRGIIHRDIKPQNIIITPEKQAKLLDFGVARLHEVTADGGDTTALLTTPGIIVGTPAYMSPEQAQQLPIDGRSDLFSLGAVLFECLTGKRPFTGRSSIDVLGAVLHQQPPEPSSLRTELTEQHDSLIERLLAKHPDDRFKSADELLGALRLLSGTSSRNPVPAPAPKLWDRWPRLRHSRWARVAVGALAVVAAIGVWSWRLPEGAPDPAAADYYRRGTDAIRDGTYHEARLALNHAIATAPSYAPTYVRLAEAEAELDDPESAQRALLKASELVPIESRLPYEHRQRFRAVRAMLLRDVDGAIRAYEQLAKAKPQDAGVLLDLGRTQDAAGLTRQALATYDKALQIDPQYAAAHLRRGGIFALEGKRAEALAEFAIAERLYRAASNVEGEIEALIRRGRALFQGGDVTGARTALERARELAGNLQNRAQEIRARLVLASLVTFEGRYQEAAVQTRAAIEDALRESLHVVAAEGLVDLVASTVWSQEVDGYLTRAVELAEKRGALRTAARARLQRAAMMAQDGHPAEALEAAKTALPYFRNNRYRVYELSALQVMSRAHEELGQYNEARSFADQALGVATELQDEFEMAQALENLGGQSNSLGKLPEALGYRARGLESHRRQKDVRGIGFDLVNNADLLIRLGRYSEASKLLDEVDRGAAAGTEAYKQRVRRAALMRLLSAAMQNRTDEVARLVARVPPSASGKPDSISELSAALLRYASPTRGGPFPEASLGSVSSPGGRELRYWDLMGRLYKSNPADVLTKVAETLADKSSVTSAEFHWRIAAIGAAAARAGQDAERERTFKAEAQRGLEQLRKEWKGDAASYEARPDLTELRRKAGLN